MFSFVGNSLASGGVRYLSFALGKKDLALLKDTFNTTMTIYSVFTLASLLIIEVVGLWLLNYKMVIPQERIEVAHVIFQFSLISFLLGLLSVPFNSALIAHERMDVYAYSTIADCFYKLAIAVALKYYWGDKLLFYGACALAWSVLMRVFYQVYCYRNFEECRTLRLRWNRKLLGGLLSYSGWNLIGVLAIVGRSQGFNILVNLFFGTLVNAAHSIAMQINGIFGQLVYNVIVPVRPQITKYYACGKIKEMWNLVFRSGKFYYYLLLFVGIPAIIELPFVLKLWLKEVPDYTILILNYLLVILLIESYVTQLYSVFQAYNRLKIIQLTSGVILLLCLPVAYLILKYIVQAVYVPYLVSFIMSIIYVFVTLIVAVRFIGLDLFRYVKSMIVPTITITVISFCIVYFVTQSLSPSIYRVFFYNSIVIVDSWIVNPFRGSKSHREAIFKKYFS
jgi:O-antigen/teichoic acid export membrane protein